MAFVVPISKAQELFQEYNFIRSLTPSAQKAAFHVMDDEGRDLCLKIINPDSNIEYLHREVIALQNLSHPNVVHLVEYTLSTRDGMLRHYIIEEFIDGTDLSECLIDGKGWELDNASWFFEQLFLGVDAIHNINVIHRDLKPSNIRVRPDGTPVIIDFGLARHLNLSDLTRTSEGAAIGTPTFFSPEQFSGTKYDIDFRTDLFALGVILYQTIVGKHPFYIEGMRYPELLDAVCHSSEYLNEPNFKGLPPNWKLIISKLLEKERAKRPHKAVQVASILRKLKGEK